MRGAWVEIALGEARRTQPLSLPVRGAWVEIIYSVSFYTISASRSPCGERGLKYLDEKPVFAPVGVAPRAGSVG